MSLTARSLSDFTVAVIGGDRRMRYAAERLSEAGAHVTTLGLGDAHTLPAAQNFAQAAQNADALLLPLPATRNGETVNCPLSPDCSVTFESIIALMRKKPDIWLFGGVLPRTLLDTVPRERTVDYYEDEALLLRNAYLTAEGALSLAMDKTDCALAGKTAAVIGYGRIGKLLARLLLSIGMEVTVCARRREVLLWAAADGARPLPMSDLPRLCGGHLVIFNTVPDEVLDRGLLLRLAPDTLLIDLASPPYGARACDIEEAERENHLVYVCAPGVPGRYAPRDAGWAIADCVSEALRRQSLFAKGETDP